MKAIVIVVVLFSATVLPSYGQESAEDKAADTDQTPLTSCDSSEMVKLRVNVLSWSEEAAVCTTIRSSMGRFPSVALARGLLKAIVVMQLNGSKDKPKDIAYQMMNIVEARGQRKNDEAIYGPSTPLQRYSMGHKGMSHLKTLTYF